MCTSSLLLLKPSPNMENTRRPDGPKQNMDADCFLFSASHKCSSSQTHLHSSKLRLTWSTMHSLCPLRVLADVKQDSLLVSLCVYTQQKRVFSWLLQARHAAESTNKQRLWVANKERNVSILAALLCDSWLLLTNGILCNQLCWSSVFTANKTSWG